MAKDTFDSIVKDFIDKGIKANTPDDFLDNSRYSAAKHFKSAFRKGWAAFQDGKDIDTCPYLENWGQSDGQPTFSYVWQKYWLDGYYAKKVLDR